MAQVKFYRGLSTAYTASIDNWKDGIFFSMDEHVIYHNKTKFGGIDPKYFSGVTKDFDIEGSRVTFQTLDEKGIWKDVSINLVAAADKSIVIGNLANDNDSNVTDGFTVSVNVKNVNAGDDGLKLDNTAQGGLYVDFTNTKAAIKANKDAIDVLKGGDTVEGSVAKSIKDTVEKLNATEVGGNGKVITTISETNGVIAATAIDLAAGNVAATAIDGSEGSTVAVTGTNVADQISSLAKSIESVSSDAKSYSVEKITGDSLTALGTNVREAYKLVDEDGRQAGEVIKIYKDSSLKDVNLVGQELQFTYILADGSEKTEGVDVSTFLAESEFSDGLQVVEHVVSVKRDSASETFLTVGKDGVRLSGVQDAINTAAAKATTKVEKAANTDKITLASTTAADGHVTYTIGQNNIAAADLLGNLDDNTDANTAFGKIANEAAVRETAIQAQEDALNAEIAARKAVDGVDTYVAEADANYISRATSLFDADVKLDAAIKAVADTAANAHTEVNDKTEGHVKVTVVNDGTHDVVTVSENDIASETALNAEITARKAVDGVTGNTYAAKANANYISGASSLFDADAKLDAALKQVADTLLWIDCGEYNASDATKA